MLKKSTQSSNLATYMRLFRSTRCYLFALALGIFGTMLASGADAWVAWAIKPLVDKGLVARDQLFLKWLPFAVIGIFMLRGGAIFISNYFIARVGRNVVMDYRGKIFAHLMHLPANFYDKATSGKLLSLIIYNAEQLASATTDALLTIVREGFLFIGLVIVMLVISWQLTLLFMVTAPILWLIVGYTTRRLRHLGSTVQESVGDITHVAEEAIEGYKVVRTFGGEAYEKKKFASVIRNNRHQEMKVVVTNSLGTAIVQVIAALPLAGILYIATLPHLNISVGSFGAMVAAMLRLLTPLRRLTKVNSVIQKGIAAAHSIFALLDTEAEQDTGSKTFTKAKGLIEYRMVNFTYPNTNKAVLNAINFSVKPGQVVALVGKSGAGKSTLVNLLPRFYDLTSGQILIDDVDVRDYKLASLRHQFALVSQHVMLFNDTIRNNISYGLFKHPQLDIIKNAAKAAHILEFIQGLPEGFDTMVGENGVLLSGGQRQRLAIARALLKDAPILILDEATSALDTEAERHIQAALSKLMLERTTLVIAHRLSTIENADLILVMDNGRIVESGTHTELLPLNGHYSRLHVLQFGKNPRQENE